MKKAELTLGQDVLYSTSKRWQHETYYCKRYRIADLNNWMKRYSWYHSVLNEYQLQDGSTFESTYIYPSSQGKGIIGQAVTNYQSGEERLGDYELLQLQYIRGPWFTTFASVQEAAARVKRICEAAKVERNRKTEVIKNALITLRDVYGLDLEAGRYMDGSYFAPQFLKLEVDEAIELLAVLTDLNVEAQGKRVNVDE